MPTSHSAHATGTQTQDTLPEASDPDTNAFPAFAYNASLHSIDTTPAPAHSTMTQTPTRASPLSAELRVQTDLKGPDLQKAYNPKTSHVFPETQSQLHQKPPFSSLPVRTPSQRSALSAHNAGTFSPSSAISSTVSSPGAGPLMDITPLPSPLMFEGSPGPWKRIPSLFRLSPPSSQYEASPTSAEDQNPPSLGLGIKTSPKKRKGYQGLVSTATLNNSAEAHTAAANISSHARNRSLSEYVPTGIPSHRPRNIAVSGAQVPSENESLLSPMHREEHLAVKRGLSPLPGAKRPPTPPRSNKSMTDSSDLESPPSSPRLKVPLAHRYEAQSVRDGRTRRWSAIRQLGKGAFSTVMLATSDPMSCTASKDGDGSNEARSALEKELHPKRLVAVKICEHGPAGGADEKRVESSLKRELDILKSIRHPSLVHLRAVSVVEKRAYLVLNYAPGGDLFELASSSSERLVPSLIRRIFAELVDAVGYLHERYIVHRDIKLENVLFNLPREACSSVTNWQTHPHPVVTLTDLGLGRRIAQPPASPLLDTRCGSEDYAAPELLMGQEYDGRATDAWALGVLLYALMEGRLPFDPIPGARRQSPTSHRIARCEWSWVKWADGDGEWDAVKGRELEGGRECVEGLVRRVKKRWGVEVVKEKDWVRGGVVVEGGLKVEGDDDDDDDDDDDEVRQRLRAEEGSWAVYV